MIGKKPREYIGGGLRGGQNLNNKNVIGAYITICREKKNYLWVAFVLFYGGKLKKNWNFKNV